MNFIDYCIATKNYSTLSAINDYMKITTRTFASKKGGSNKGGKTAAKVAAGVAGAGALGAAGYLAYPRVKQYLDEKEIKDRYGEKALEDMKTYKSLSSDEQEAANKLVEKGMAPSDALKSAKYEATKQKAEDDLADAKYEDTDAEDAATTVGFSAIRKRYGKYFR